MFDLVSDIGSYAQFLPWVVGVRIRSRTEQAILADLLVGFGPLREKFTSRVTLDSPGSMEVEHIDGPTEYLHPDSPFRPEGNGGPLGAVHIVLAFPYRMLPRLPATRSKSGPSERVKMIDAEA